MTTAELIESHLGPGWVTRTHDDTALLSLLDRVSEEQDVPMLDAVKRIGRCAEEVTPKGNETLIEVKWVTRLWTLLKSVAPTAVHQPYHVPRNN